MREIRDILIIIIIALLLFGVITILSCMLFNINISPAFSENMEICTIILFIILFALVYILNRKSLSIIKTNEIQDYLNEYYLKYKDNQFVEVNSKLDETRASFSNNMLSHLVTKGVTVQKVILKNNMIELYDKNYNKLKNYQVEQVDIKYDILIRGGRWKTRYINIYFNDDNYTSIANNNYDVEAYIESYIAFVIFVNLLKRNELEKINNLNDDEIKKLQQNYIYSDSIC